MARRRARSSTACALDSDAAPSAARATGKLEVLGVESADPRWVRRSRPTRWPRRAHRLRAIGAIAVVAVPGRGRALRRDGHRCSAAAPWTPRPRS